jgi:hypothetical protein
VSILSSRNAAGIVAFAAIIASACSPRDSRARDTSGDGVVAAQTFGPLGIPVGVALPDYRTATANRWCVGFEDVELIAGDPVTLVWPDSAESAPAAVLTRVETARHGRCAQNLVDTTDLEGADLGIVYELTLASANDSLKVAEVRGTPAIAVRGESHWTRGPTGFPRADLDDDENPEQARLCTSSEGVHLTLWTLADSATADQPAERRRWHGYQSLGYDVEPTCTERETDEAPEPPTAPSGSQI